MTTGFGTENICWVPEGEPLRFIDLFHWAEWRLDLDRWRLAMSAEAVVELRDRARHGLKLCRIRGERDPDLLSDVEHAEEFIDSLSHALEAPAANLPTVSLARGPLTSLWVRISDLPLESFFDEDYRFAPPPIESVARLKVMGELRLPACDELEIPMSETSEETFTILMPTGDSVGEYPLPADEPPPILDEYCGLRGNSNRGKAVNLGLDGRICGENPLATPLSQLSDEGGFITLYLHFRTPLTHTVMMPLASSHVHRVEASLQGQGFERVLSERRNQVWQRGEDWVHCLWNLPGLESEDVPVLNPVIVVARAEGSRDPGLREALLGAILKTALGEVPDPRR